MGTFALLADIERRRQPNGSQSALATFYTVFVGEAVWVLFGLGALGAPQQRAYGVWLLDS